MSEFKIIILLPVHNRLDTTKKFIKCLKEQNYKNYILLLIDDGCTDGTVEHVKKNISNLTVLNSDGNLWWAGALDKAYNYLFDNKNHDNDILLIANDDVTFESDYLKNLVADIQVNEKRLIISPGYDIDSNFIERGFLIDWKRFLIEKMQEDGLPDAVTTRCLYMKLCDFKKIGGFYPKLLPQYLSDLEYTIRAKRKGYSLHISKITHIKVDRKTTGQHKDNSGNIREYFYNYFLSKKTAYNITYWSIFIILAAPWKYKISCLFLLYKRHAKKALRYLYMKCEN